MCVCVCVCVCVYVCVCVCVCVCYTNLTFRWGYPDGMSPEGGWVSFHRASKPSLLKRHSIRVSPPCHIGFLYQTNLYLVKYQ